MSAPGIQATPPERSEAVVLEKLDAGALWRVRLATPKANVLDMAKLERLGEIFEAAAEERSLKAILLEGEGPHFSFGASVEEHLPDRFEAMLATFHGLFRKMLGARVATLAAVRGQCLGGALELASVCNRVFASHDAKLGQPEIKLGVLAPVASVFLRERVGRGLAEDLCLTGRTLSADEALRSGLVDVVAADPALAALAYAREQLLPCSASSLRFAQQALRAGLAARLGDLEHVETIYAELMKTHDAQEGLAAFLAKRAPCWIDA